VTVHLYRRNGSADYRQCNCQSDGRSGQR
jgi:hypothetical protein